MKRLLVLLFALLFVPCLCAQISVDVTLGWDQEASLDINLVKEIRIYNILQDPEVLVATAVCSGEAPNVVCPYEVTFQHQTGTSATWVARNYDGVQESANSNSVSTEVLPAPKNLHK